MTSITTHNGYEISIDGSDWIVTKDGVLVMTPPRRFKYFEVQSMVDDHIENEAANPFGEEHAAHA